MNGSVLDEQMVHGGWLRRPVRPLAQRPVREATACEGRPFEAVRGSAAIHRRSGGMLGRLAKPARIARRAALDSRTAPCFLTEEVGARPGPSRIAQDTSLAPHAIASGVWEEAGAWLGVELPREWLTRLTERAEAVYARNLRARRRLRSPGNAGRDWLWAFMRHWLAALIQRRRPELYARFPSEFATGHPLPPGRATDAETANRPWRCLGVRSPEARGRGH